MFMKKTTVDLTKKSVGAEKKEEAKPAPKKGILGFLGKKPATKEVEPVKPKKEDEEMTH